jgi:hypothetical protein
VPLNDRRGLTEAETEILHRQWRRRHDQIHDAVAKHGAGGGYQEAAPAQWTLLAWTSRSAAFDVTRGRSQSTSDGSEATTGPEPAFVAPVICVPGHGLTGRLIPTE